MRALAVIGLVLSSLFGGQAAAERTPEQLLLQNLPAGYSEVPAGEGNGPVDMNTLQEFGGGSAEELEGVFESGFQRTWVSPETGDFITSMVLAFEEPVD